MPVISSTNDPEALTLTIVAEFPAPPERVWRLWEDPGQLGRWWGPPGWPATFTRHDFTVPGRSAYYMTGPDGTRYHGYWDYLVIEAPSRLEVRDGFADAEGEPANDMPGPTSLITTIEPVGDVTRMTIASHFATADDLAKQLEMGMEEGMTLALEQIDALLAEH